MSDESSYQTEEPQTTAEQQPQTEPIEDLSEPSRRAQTEEDAEELSSRKWAERRGERGAEAQSSGLAHRVPLDPHRQNA